MEKRDIRAKTGTYTKDGKTKNRYMNIGVAFISQNQSDIILQIDTMPFDWDGRAYIQSESKTKDKLEKPIQLNDY